MGLPRWIRTPAELHALAASLGESAAVAIDTEADSLHHYPGKLCLVQIADDRGRGYLVDPLALRSLAALGPLCADAGIVKVFHAADNDLAYLKRLYGFTVAELFDTALAARFLGESALSLDALLARHLGVEPVKSRQKDDWSRRPLSRAQEEYALNDVLHLIALRSRLLEELRAKGRDEWVAEECAAVAAASVPDKVVDPEAYLNLKGARALDRRGWAVLRELYRAREALALELDRPPFMIVSHEALVALAVKRPRQLDEVLAVPGCSARVAARAGQAILEAVARGETAPEPAPPARRGPYRPPVPAVVRRRADALRTWRSEVARELALDPGVFFPQRLIDRLAAEPPGDLTALEQVEGVRRWRVKLFGSDLLRVLAAVQ